MNTLQAAISTSRHWPEINEPLRADVMADGGRLADLWELSPVRIEDNRPRTEEILDRLFPGNPLLCAGRNRYRFDTKPREAWRGRLAERQFIVPSPMSAVRGKTKEGRWSKHTAANTGPRRFLVCEFDSGTEDDQAALLMHLEVSSILWTKRVEWQTKKANTLCHELTKLTMPRFASRRWNWR